MKKRKEKLQLSASLVRDCPHHGLEMSEPKVIAEKTFETYESEDTSSSVGYSPAYAAGWEAVFGKKDRKDAN